MIASVLEGYSATLFAYGQTGAGKTHTMTGDVEDPQGPGVCSRAVVCLFTRLQALTASPHHYPWPTFIPGLGKRSADMALTLVLASGIHSSKKGLGIKTLCLLSKRML